VTDLAHGPAATGSARHGPALAGLAVLLLIAAPAPAHKLAVFAAAEGARIEGSAYFAGGGKASGARILITDAAGSVLAELEPAADGSFSYLAGAPMEHRIIAETVDGHRAEWRVAAEALAGGFASASAGAPEAAAGKGAGLTADLAAGPSGGPAAGAAPVAAAAAPAPNPSPDLAAAIERAVARQLRPLREELLATRDALRLRDILGGIGYIFGLAGLTLWWHGGRSRQDG